MSVKLLKVPIKAARAHLSLYLSKCHIVGNHMSRLIYFLRKHILIHQLFHLI